MEKDSPISEDTERLRIVVILSSNGILIKSGSGILGNNTAELTGKIIAYTATDASEIKRHRANIILCNVFNFKYIQKNTAFYSKSCRKNPPVSNCISPSCDAGFKAWPLVFPAPAGSLFWTVRFRSFPKGNRSTCSFRHTRPPYNPGVFFLIWIHHGGLLRGRSF